MSKEAMKMSLEALGEILESFEKDGKFCKSSLIRNELFDRIKATFDKCKAIVDAEKQEQGELVALKIYRGELCYKSQADDQSFGMWCPVTQELLFTEGTKFYTTPQQRTWVGLTLEERDHLWEVSRAGLPRYNTFAGLVEAKLKEKNT